MFYYLHLYSIINNSANWYFFILLFIKYFNDNYNYNSNRESIEMLNNINNTNTINNVIYIDDKKECCICLDKNTTEWVRTPCDHEFHKKCINDWYKTKNTCPICRSNL